MALIQNPATVLCRISIRSRKKKTVNGNNWLQKLRNHHFSGICVINSCSSQTSALYMSLVMFKVVIVTNHAQNDTKAKIRELIHLWNQYKKTVFWITDIISNLFTHVVWESNLFIHISLAIRIFNCQQHDRIGLEDLFTPIICKMEAQILRQPWVL